LDLFVMPLRFPFKPSFGRYFGRYLKAKDIPVNKRPMITSRKRMEATASILAIALTAVSWLLATSVQCQDPRSTADSLLSRNFVADVVEAVSPAVVNIVCSTGYGVVSSGSGFILNSDGFVVTNAHVVSANNGRVVVTLFDGKKREAFVHSVDSASDIALLRLHDTSSSSSSSAYWPISSSTTTAAGADRLEPASLGCSHKVRSGEFVIAIGSPMQLANSASLGIVSATARHASELGLSNNRSEYIQTDAAINTGNSGGPLVNLDGEVIGINTMKVRGTDGISFAIPIDVASQIIQQLLLSKKVTRPFVGLKMANVLPDSVRNSGRGGRGLLPSLSTHEMQVIVVEVVPDSPASKAGLTR
jgi:HtrA serine peptidase 2